MIEKRTFTQGIKSSFPIMTGYIPIAIAYGVIGIKAGLPAWVIIAMSVFIYAGASQFMAINLFTLGTAPLEMMIAVGVLNLRHVVMGMSFQNRINVSFTDRILTSLGLTDETFAFLSLDNDLNGSYAKGVMLGSYLSWVFGAAAGIVFGNILPDVISQGLEIAIYTLFITLLVSSLKVSGNMLYVPLVSMITNSIISQRLSSGLSILISILAGALAGMIFGGDEY
ncbi:AzlC family ABC transporter permease [Proteiniclasticum sp.]|uniref:AzlC family ABC transporter permease n=1 Tax=Proteiniclasticum sp. TaxID=2053595 RepID=UPI00289758AB|nr:AzlC family ABC transporter permease [Proteiniclasticum sp.]